MFAPTWAHEPTDRWKAHDGGRPPHTTWPSTHEIMFRSDLVRHRPARRAEVAQRRVRPEVRDPRGVEVGIVVDLLAEPRILVALAQARAPVRVVRAIDPGVERIDL